MTRMGCSFHLIKAFHPQGDGRSECTNKTVGQVLRTFTSKKQGKWLEALPAVEFAINGAVNTATGHSPLSLIAGRAPKLFPTTLSQEIDPPAVDAWLRLREGAWAEAHYNLWASRFHQAIKHNKKRRPGQDTPTGSRVLLSTTDWQDRLPGTTDKLKDRFEGPYQVIRSFNNGKEVELDLPETDRRHWVVHVSKVRPFMEREGSLQK